MAGLLGGSPMPRGACSAWWLLLFRPALEAFREPRHLAALVIYLHASALVTGLGSLFLFLSLRSLLRAKSLAMVAWIVGYGVVVVRTATLGSDWRVGLPRSSLPAVAAGVPGARPLRPGRAVRDGVHQQRASTSLPAALEFSAWYSNRSLISLGIIVGIGLYGARTAVRSLGEGSDRRHRSSDRRPPVSPRGGPARAPVSSAAGGGRRTVVSGDAGAEAGDTLAKSLVEVRIKHEPGVEQIWR